MSFKEPAEAVNAHHCILLFSVYYESQSLQPINIDKLLSLPMLMYSIPGALYCLEEFGSEPSESFHLIFISSITFSVQPLCLHLPMAVH